MGIAGNKWGFTVGRLPHGPLDKISDVPGVTVGHCTLAEGNIQTGVTALPVMTLTPSRHMASARPPALSRSMNWARWKRRFCSPIR